MIGSVLLAPVAVAQLQAIPLCGLIRWVTWSRAHKSSVGAARKVSPNWSQETMTCHSSNCFSIVWDQGRTIGDFSSILRREGRGLISEQRMTIEAKRSS